MKRIILKTPDDTTLEALSDEHKTALNSVFAQFVMPMPGTQSYLGYKIIDAVVADNFNPAAMTDLLFPFELLGMWEFVEDSLTTLVPLANSFIDYLPSTHTYDADFNIASTMPAIFHIPHRWAGWPEETYELINRNKS